MKPGGFAGNIDEVRAQARAAKDLASSIERVADSYTRTNGVAQLWQRHLSDISKELERNNAIASQGVGTTKKQYSAYKAAKDAAAGLEKQLRRLKIGGEIAGTMWNGFDKLGKNLFRMQKGIMASFFGFLVDSIKRVYELQERWTRAIGAFNMKLGGMTAGIGSARKAASAWEGTMYGLTDQFGQGIQMFGEFTIAMSRTVEKGDQFERFGLQLARGFNLGAQAAGELTRTFENMGIDGVGAQRVMANVITTAEKAHVPVNLLAKDLAETNNFMARFGKEGARGFVLAAGYARKFGVSMRELQRATEKFDMFDEAALTASKLNVLFGTAVDGFKLMLEDDPAKRFETIRRSLIAQGQTYDKLTPKQVRYLAETTGLTEKQVAAMLDAKNAGVTYAQFQERQAKEEKAELNAKKLMERQLRSTAQTMFAFNQAFDRVTMAIARAIKPLLEVFGLAKSGDKDFKSFGEVMGRVTDHVVSFFDQLAKNKRWMGFMKELGQDLKRFGKAVGEWIMDGGAVKVAMRFVEVVRSIYDWGKKAFDTLLPMMQKFSHVLGFVLDNSLAIVAAWAGMKGALATLGAVMKLRGTSTGAAIGDMAGGIGGKLKGAAKTRLGQGAMMAGGGMAAAALTGGGSIGGAAGGLAGGVLGGVAGAFLGPAGAMIGKAIGTAVGGWLGGKGENLIRGLWGKGPKEKTDLEVQMERMASKQARLVDIQKHNTKVEELTGRIRDANSERLSIAHDAQLEALKGNKQAIDALNISYSKQTEAIERLRSMDDKEYAKRIEKAKFEEQLALKESNAKIADLRAQSLEAKGLFEMFDPNKVGERARAQKEARDATEAFTDASIRASLVEQRLMRQKLLISTFEADFMRQQAAGLFGNKSIADARVQFFTDMATSGKGGVTLEDAQGFRQMAQGTFAQGGIVRRPTRALIGEAGPEAVIPLRAMGKTKRRNPRKFGGDAASNLVNYAAGGGNRGGGSRVIQVESKIVLDGKQVGRGLTRSILESGDM
jgi:DNA-binding ferritin-like protein (Dps family)